MASLKVSSGIEHVCLQEWNLSASWLQGDFDAWTFTDTILLAVLLIPSLHHHLKCICLNLFHLPLSCPMFFPHLQSFLHPYLFYSTHLIFPLFLHPLCPGIFPAVSSRDLCPYRQNDISQSSLPPLCIRTRESCSRNRSAYTWPRGMTWGSSNKSSL